MKQTVSQTAQLFCFRTRNTEDNSGVFETAPATVAFFVFA